MSIVATWHKALHQALYDEPTTVTDVRIGVFYTAVQLANGHAGVAFTPRELQDTVCCPHSAAAAPPAGRLAGQEAWELASYAVSPVALRRAVGVAVLNALSARALERYGVPGGRLCVGLDALHAAAVQPQDRVALVGAFIPFIKALKHQVANLSIIDKHRDALKGDERAFWRAPEQAVATLAQADVVIITGSSLVEGGLDTLLAACSQARTVVLAGPTASPWPPPFFAHGVHVLGGLRIRDGAQLLRVVSEGGSGYFFDGVAEKVCVIREA